MKNLKKKIREILRWSEKYTKTDMVYLAKGGFWKVLGKVITFLIGFGTMSALSRWLSKESFGNYQYVLSIVSIFGLSTLSGTGPALTRAVARGKEGMLIKVAKEKSKWSVLGTLICLAIGFWYLWLGKSTLGYAFLIASFFFPLPRIFNIYTPFWHGKKSFDVEAKATMGINLLEALIFIPAIYYFENFLLILLAYFISRSIFRGLVFYLTSRNVSNEKCDNATIPYGKHLTIMGAIETFARHIDKVIIWQFLGPVQVAVYAFAKKPVTRLKQVMPVSQLALPKLSEREVKEIKPQLLEKFYKLFFVSVISAVGFYFLSPLLYKAVFPEYLDSVPYARGLGLLFVLFPFTLLRTALVSELKKGELYIIRFVAPGVRIVCFSLLVPFYGIWGIIAGILIGELARGVLGYYYFTKL